MNNASPWMTNSRVVWLDEIATWLREKLAQRNLPPHILLESVREQPWSIVLRTSTSQGFVYFKASASDGRHEPELLTALAQQWPDQVPVPLATDPHRGWMLLPDYGVPLRSLFDETDQINIWERLLPRYAEIQIASSTNTQRWLNLGVPDRRVERLPTLLTTLLADDGALCIGQLGGLLESERAAIRNLLPEVEAYCRDLAAMPHSAALDHGDLHDGNVLVQDDNYRFVDWGDANLTHPFFSLLVTCPVDDLAGSEGKKTVARLRDAYLEPWGKYAPVQSLRLLFNSALWVAHVGRALNWHHMLAGTGPSAQAQWQPRVAT